MREEVEEMSGRESVREREQTLNEVIKERGRGRGRMK